MISRQRRSLLPAIHPLAVTTIVVPIFNCNDPRPSCCCIMRHEDVPFEGAAVARRNSARRHSIHGHVMIPGHSRAVSEQDLLREVIFAFQGLNGKILVQDPDNDNRYMVSPGYVINPSTKELALRLTNLGWLFNRINGFCQKVAKEETAQGFVLQSFAAVLSEEIVEYYRIIAIIEQQLHFLSGASAGRSQNEASPQVSLFRLQVWTMDHFYRLKMLALLIEECKRKRGGALVNVVYRKMQTGDPQLKRCLTRILKKGEPGSVLIIFFSFRQGG